MIFFELLKEAASQIYWLCATAIGRSFSVFFKIQTAGADGQNSMPAASSKKKVIAAVSIAAIIISLIRLGFMLRNPSPKIDLSLYRTTGSVCAEETAKLTDGYGQVVVITFDTAHASMPALEEELAGFKQSLNRRSGMNLLATETLPVLHAPLFPALTIAYLVSVSKRYSNATVIVSLVGVPQANNEEIAAWPPSGPRLVIVGAHDPDGKLTNFFDEGIIIETRIIE